MWWCPARIYEDVTPCIVTFSHRTIEDCLASEVPCVQKNENLFQIYSIIKTGWQIEKPWLYSVLLESTPEAEKH